LWLLLPARLQAFDFMQDSGLAETAQGTGHSEVGDMTVPEMIGIVVSAILGLLGVVFLLLTIYAGILWMTAAGNEQQVAKAKKMLTNSIVGLLIVVGAYAITAFIGAQLGS